MKCTHKLAIFHRYYSFYNFNIKTQQSSLEYESLKTHMIRQVFTSKELRIKLIKTMQTANEHTLDFKELCPLSIL